MALCVRPWLTLRSSRRKKAGKWAWAGLGKIQFGAHEEPNNSSEGQTYHTLSQSDLREMEEKEKKKKEKKEKEEKE